MSNGDTPALEAFTVIDRGKGKDGFWQKLGAAWANKDGKGFTLQLHATPLDGRLVLLPYKPPNGDDKK